MYRCSDTRFLVNLIFQIYVNADACYSLSPWLPPGWASIIWGRQGEDTNPTHRAISPPNFKRKIFTGCKSMGVKPDIAESYRSTGKQMKRRYKCQKMSGRVQTEFIYPLVKGIIYCIWYQFISFVLSLNVHRNEYYVLGVLE